MIALLLDPENTAVTYRTAVALLTLRKPEAVRLIVAASSWADENVNDWIGSAFEDFRAESLGADDAVLRWARAAIQEDPDEGCSNTAREWSAWCGFVPGTADHR